MDRRIAPRGKQPAWLPDRLTTRSLDFSIAPSVLPLTPPCRAGENALCQGWGRLVPTVATVSRRGSGTTSTKSSRPQRSPSTTSVIPPESSARRGRVEQYSRTMDSTDAPDARRSLDVCEAIYSAREMRRWGTAEVARRVGMRTELEHHGRPMDVLDRLAPPTAQPRARGAWTTRTRDAAGRGADRRRRRRGACPSFASL